MKTVIFHIGAGKTGSSAIQSGLARYSSELAKDYDICYPEPKDSQSAAQGKITSGNGTDLLMFLCPNKRAVYFDEVKFLDDFVKIVTGSNQSKIIFSNEQLEEGDRAQWLQLISLLDNIGVISQFVYYVRYFADHAYSVYGQMVKRSGYNKKFSEYAIVYKAKYRQTLEKLLSFSNRSKITIKVYEQVKRDIFNDFIVSLSGSTSNFDRIENVNRSLSIAELEILRQLNEKVDDNMVSFHLSNWLIYNRNADKEPFYISKADLNNIETTNKEIAEWVNKTFFKGRELLKWSSDKVKLVEGGNKYDQRDILDISSSLISHTVEKHRAELNSLKYNNLFQQAKLDRYANNKAEAKAKFEKLIRMQPLDHKPKRQLAEILFENSEYQKAHMLMSEVIEIVGCKDLHMKLLIEIEKKMKS